MKRNQLLIMIALGILSFRTFAFAAEPEAVESPAPGSSEATEVETATALAPASVEEAAPADGAGIPEQPAVTEEIKAVEEKPADEKASGEEKVKWEYPPIIQINSWGGELKIVVEPNLLMDRDKIALIQSVRLETEKGDFLGLKTYTPEEYKKRAEFVLSPEVLKITKAKITVNSKEEGDWIKIIPLKVSTAKEITAYSQAEDTIKEEAVAADEAKKVAAAPIAEQPKKKGWW